MDLFVLSSRREGLPNSILEAMAVGLPVVTTDVAGTGELVLDGHTGYVVPQGDVERLAQAMVTLVADQKLRQRMAQAGRERIERAFSFTQRLQRIEELYARIIGVPLTRSLAEREAFGAAL
jgi:glycosyltransferase involved in cell wall biosynthesis